MSYPTLIEHPALWPLALYFVLALGLVVAMVVVSHLLGQRHSDRATVEPYESGMLPVGNARTLFSVKFYIVSLLFLVFDLEAVYIFAWAVSFKGLPQEARFSSYIGAFIFIATLTIVLVYVVRMGALNWSSSSRKQAAALSRASSAQHTNR